jgi:hypothetical protein
MNKIQINFYDEIVSTVCPANFETLKNVISRKFSLEKQDVEELIIFYLNESDRITISNNEDLKIALSSKEKGQQFTVFLEVSEKSRLYKNEAVVDDIKVEEVSEKKDSVEEKPELQKEIKAKETELRDLLEKEKREKDEEKAKLIEEEKAKLIEEEKAKKLEHIVVESVNKQLEALKESLIKNTMKEAATKLKTEGVKTNTTVHSRFTCDGCGMTPIVGVRYHCTVCFNYDLCQSCESKESHAQDHPLEKHKTEKQVIFRPCPQFPPVSMKDFFKPLCRPFRNKFKFHKQVKAMRDRFDLKDFSDEKLAEALQKAHGNVELALTFLF